jgi:hypothetical protein
MSNANILRITATDGTTTTIPDNRIYSLGTSAVLESHCLGKRINSVNYQVDRNTDNNVTGIAIFNGANALYEYGWYENSGAFITSLSNRN